MRKFLSLVIFIFLICPMTFAATNWNSAAALKRVNTIGNKLVKANGVKQTITFKVSNQEDLNAYANASKEIYVFKGLLQYVTNDEELAAVIAHETGHIINGHSAKQSVLNTGMNAVTAVASVKYNPTALAIGNEYASSKLSKHDEFEADLTGVDLMAKAGYNPLATISLLSKICGEDYNDFLKTHPTGSKRILNAYNYIEYNYPQKLKTGFNSTAYKEAVKAISPKVEKRHNSKLLTKKYEHEQKSLLKRKAKRMKKMAKSSTVWDGYYNTLFGTSN